MAKTILQMEPTHYGANGSVHYPQRCALCWVQRFLLYIGVIEFEEDGEWHEIRND